jgi:hypothetical protein
MFDVTDRETRIDNEPSGELDLGFALNEGFVENWVSLDIDPSGKYLAVSRSKIPDSQNCGAGTLQTH